MCSYKVSTLVQGKSTADPEKMRVEALHNYNILDTQSEKEFDRLTELAAIICEVPYAGISLIDEKRQWFKSKYGHNIGETKKEIAICNYVISGKDVFEVEDISKDQRFDKFHLTNNHPPVRFYAGYPLIDPDGFALGTLCVMDLKPKKLNENQQLALSTLAKEVVLQIVSRKEKSEKKQFEELFLNSIDMVCIANLEGYFTKVNPAFTTVLGWSHKELTDNSFLHFVHPEDREKTFEEISKLSAGIRTINFSNRYLTKSGEYKVLNWVANPDLNSKAIYAIARDQTETARAQKRIHEAEKKFRDVFENSPDAIFVEDSDGNIIDVNAAACDLQGLPKEKLIGGNIKDLVPPEKFLKIISDYKKIFYGVLSMVESYVWSHTRGEVPVEVSGKKIAYGDTSVLLLQVRDISERKKLEAERSRLVSETNQRQAEEIKTNLKVKEDERNRIAIEMHDEVGSGLSKISILGHVIKKRVNDPVAVSNSIDKILSSSKTVQENISEIIWAMNTKNDTLENLVAYINYYTSELLSSADVTFKMKIPEELPLIGINGATRRNIFLVIKEALNNIVKYAAAPLVTIDIHFKNGVFTVRINDTGKGFHLNKVRRFSNGIQSMKKRMEDVNGVFHIISTEGEGTTVYLEVPVLFQNE